MLNPGTLQHEFFNTFTETYQQPSGNFILQSFII